MRRRSIDRGPQRPRSRSLESVLDLVAGGAGLPVGSVLFILDGLRSVPPESKATARRSTSRRRRAGTRRAYHVPAGSLVLIAQPQVTDAIRRGAGGQHYSGVRPGRFFGEVTAGFEAMPL